MWVAIYYHKQIYTNTPPFLSLFSLNKKMMTNNFRTMIFMWPMRRLWHGFKKAQSLFFKFWVWGAWFFCCPNVFPLSSIMLHNAIIFVCEKHSNNIHISLKCMSPKRKWVITQNLIWKGGQLKGSKFKLT